MDFKDGILIKNRINDQYTILLSAKHKHVFSYDDILNHYAYLAHMVEKSSSQSWVIEGKMTQFAMCINCRGSILILLSPKEFVKRCIFKMNKVKDVIGITNKRYEAKYASKL